MKLVLPNRTELERIIPPDEKAHLFGPYTLLDISDFGLRALEIVVEEMAIEVYKPGGEEAGDSPQYHYPHERHLQNPSLPSIMLVLDEVGVPFLVLRLYGEQGLCTSETQCDVMNITGFFAGKAIRLITDLKDSGMVISDEDTEVFIIRKSANMLKTALQKFHERFELTIRSFCEEAWWDWAALWYEYHATFNSLQGFKMERLSFAKAKDNQLKQHLEDLHALWRDDSGEQLNDLKKQALAINYRKSYEHWKEIERLQLEGKNWRRYVKADDMDDITDDLIEMFEKGTDLSGLALEHAARRSELFNIFEVGEKRLEKRKMGVKDSGYSRAMLFRLKREGELLLQKKYETQSTDESER